MLIAKDVAAKAKRNAAAMSPASSPSAERSKLAGDTSKKPSLKAGKSPRETATAAGITPIANAGVRS